MRYKQFYIPVSLACCGHTQTDFCIRVKVGNTTLGMTAADDKWEVDDPGEVASGFL